MADAIVEEPRLAQIYDDLDPDRSDLDAYAAMAGEFGAASVLDVGCGTGTLACLLAGRGLEVTAVDPAAACLEVARRKPGAGGVRWVHGNVTDLPPLQVDLVTMTADVAQVFVTGQERAETLAAVHRALRPGGRLVFESRDPARKAWLDWTRDHTYRRAAIPGAGPAETWIDLTGIQGNLVSFRASFVFGRDGAMLTSGSTLRSRSRTELTGSPAAAALTAEEIRDAPDRPGREFAYIARRAPAHTTGATHHRCP
jgi:SAM-dependent methyltransferase